MRTALKRLQQIALGLCIAFWSTTTPTRSQNSGSLRIEIQWAETLDRIDPAPQTNIYVKHRIELVLDGNKVQQSTSDDSGYHRKDYLSAAPLGGIWKVGLGNTVRRVDDHPTYVRTIVIRVAGRSCTASVRNERKPGSRVYQMGMLSRPGTTGTYSRLETSSASCTIAGA